MRTLVKACVMQLERGDHFVWENPRGSAMWRESLLHQLLAIGKGRVRTVDSHMCAYEKRGRSGKLLLKPSRWMFSHPFLAKALSRRCTRDHDHEVIEGTLSTMLNGVYSEELANCVCDAVVRIKAEESGHLCYVEDVNYDRLYPWKEELTDSHETSMPCRTTRCGGRFSNEQRKFSKDKANRTITLSCTARCGRISSTWCPGGSKLFRSRSSRRQKGWPGISRLRTAVQCSGWLMGVSR